MNNSKAKYKIFISLVVFTLLIIGFTPFLELSPNNSRDSQQQLDNPKTNANEIILITPENKTYTEPITGYYPATYGFENDILNSFPYGWIDEDVSTCETKVIGTLDGHNGIVQQYDNHGSAAAQMSKDIPATAIITVEFWARTDLLTFVYFNVRDSLSTYNTWDLRDLSGFSVDTWHHVRFVINTITDKYDSYLDGVLKNNQANLPNPMNDVDQIQFNTAPSQINYNIWWDAIGGNWDPNYNIGDNLEEGLLISFENSTNLEWKGYSLDDQANKTILGNTTIPLPEDGNHNIQVFGKDSLGTIYSSDMRYFSVDTLSPIITINSPLQNEYFGSTAPNFDVSITEPNLNTTWYTLDSGLTNFTFTGFTGTINQTEWDDQVDGSIIIRFYANDTFGHINYAEVLVEKDSIIPSIIINSPNADDYYGSIPPDFGISIEELNIDTTWYTIDDGITNIIFTGLTGTIDQSEWDKKTDGQVTIRFYANDTFGHLNYTDVLINKDTLDPVITINSPLVGEIFTDLPPEFNLIIDEVNLDATWYTIDDGITNITFTGLTGYIDSTAWNNAPIGAVTIRFYARDLAGNDVYQEVVVIKQSPSQPPAILGYDVVMLISVLSFFSVLIIKKISRK
jgi:hypothetical protein